MPDGLLTVLYMDSSPLWFMVQLIMDVNDLSLSKSSLCEVNKDCTLISKSSYECLTHCFSISFNNLYRKRTSIVRFLYISVIQCEVDKIISHSLSSPNRCSLMGEREMEFDFSSLHLLADTAVAVLEGELSLPGELPRIFWEQVLEMRGQDLMLVLEKRLQASDMNPNQARLSIPRLQTKKICLSDEEIQTLDNNEGITVSLVEPCRQVRHGLQLKKWNYDGRNFSYVLTTGWNTVAHPFEPNRLEVGGLVQLWSFRVDGNLCFCLVNLEAPLVTEENMPIHE